MVGRCRVAVWTLFVFNSTSYMTQHEVVLVVNSFFSFVIVLSLEDAIAFRAFLRTRYVLRSFFLCLITPKWVLTPETGLNTRFLLAGEGVQTHYSGAFRRCRDPFWAW